MPPRPSYFTVRILSRRQKLNRDSGPASVADHDFIAAAHNHIESLLDEIDRLPKELLEREQ